MNWCCIILYQKDFFVHSFIPPKSTCARTRRCTQCTMQTCTLNFWCVLVIQGKLTEGGGEAMVSNCSKKLIVFVTCIGFFYCGKKWVKTKDARRSFVQFKQTYIVTRMYCAERAGKLKIATEKIIRGLSFFFCCVYENREMFWGESREGKETCIAADYNCWDKFGCVWPVSEWGNGMKWVY